MRKLLLGTVLLACFVAQVTLGQNAGSTPTTQITVQLERQGGTPHLTDGQGMSLYVYLSDSKGQSTCYDRCQRNWLPLVAEGQPTAGRGVRAALLGTTERRDGSRQVTYNDWPLYTFVRDEAAGDMNGQGVGDLLYVVSPAGEAVQDAVAVAASSGEGDEGAIDDLVAEGEPIFTSICATCHGAEGQGIVGPRLDGNAAVGRPTNVINTILYGRTHGGMPAFGDRFSDREVAAVGTYVRNSWSNAFGPLSEEEVNELR